MRFRRQTGATLPPRRQPSLAPRSRRTAAGILWGVAEANVDALKRGYAAINRGDLSVLRELLHPDIEWHEPGPSLDAGTHRGRESFERFLRGWLESFDEFQVEPEQVVERDGRLIAVVRQTGKGRSSGLQVDARLAHIWTVEAGRAVRWEAVANPEDALGEAR
jgi:ketosteroid isomerase-like protein